MGLQVKLAAFRTMRATVKGSLVLYVRGCQTMTCSVPRESSGWPNPYCATLPPPVGYQNGYTYFVLLMMRLYKTMGISRKGNEENLTLKQYRAAVA